MENEAMVTKQSSKPAKSKAEAKVDTGAANRIESIGVPAGALGLPPPRLMLSTLIVLVVPSLMKPLLRLGLLWLPVAPPRFCPMFSVPAVRVLVTPRSSDPYGPLVVLAP